VSFDTERLKPASNKLYLFELDMPLPTDTFYSAQAGIWQIPVSPYLGPTGVTILCDDGSVAFFEETNMVELLRIGSMNVDYEHYSRQTSMAACIAQNKSFYYDNLTYMIFVHFDGFTVPWGHVVELGIIMGFSNKPDSDNNAYYDDIYYEPRILSVPALTKQRDNLFYGILQYTGGSVVLNNQDGYFEDLIGSINIYGQPVRLYAGFDGLSFGEFRQIYEGMVDDYSYDFDSFSLNLADIKKFLTRKLPINQFLTSVYPDLNSNNNYKGKPLAWGSIRNAPLICLNEMSTVPSTYQFYLADTSYNSILSVGAVYMQGMELSTTNWSWSGDKVYISTSASTSSGGSTLTIDASLQGVTADFVSASTTMLGLNVISDILKNYAFLSTDSLVGNYDSTEWATSLALSRQVAIYINEEKEINEIIKDICVSEDGYLLVLDNGSFTFKKDSTTYTTIRQIYSDEWLDDPQIEYKREEYLTSVKISYDKNQFSNSFRRYINTNYETVSYNKYKTYALGEMETALTSTTDVYNKSELIMIHSKDIIPTVTRKIKQTHIDLEVGDIILAEHGRESDTTKYWKQWKLISISKDLDNAELTWVMRWVSDSTT